jgi:trimeric autotransporter adhesin
MKKLIFFSNPFGVKDDKDGQRKYDAEKATQSGFIAQQVDSAAQACGYDFNGVSHPGTPGGLYALGYTDFVVPLVKAVQELSAKNDSLTTVLQNIQTCLNQICSGTGNNFPGNTDGNSTPVSEQNITLGSADAPLLYQNSPNPFSTGTKINYYLPEGTVGAVIVFYDSYGNQIRTLQISQTGNGTLNITPDNLTNGIYSYSLMVNSRLIDTKRMVLQK